MGSNKNNLTVVVLDSEVSNSLLREQDEFVLIDEFVSSSFEEERKPKEEPRPQTQPPNLLDTAATSLNQFFQNFPAMIGTNTQALSQLFQQVTDTVDSTVESVKPVLGELVANNQSQFEQVACTMKDTVEDVLKTASKNINDLFANQSNPGNTEIFDGPVLDASFVSDENIVDRTVMEPGTKFTKTWKIKNTGETAWPAGTFLQFVGGSKMNCKDGVIVGGVEPQEIVSVSVDMEVPDQPGRYTTYFRLCCPVNGRVPFGTRLWCEVIVPKQFEYPKQLQVLLDMGFPEEISKPLLEANNGDLEVCLGELLN